MTDQLPSNGNNYRKKPVVIQAVRFTGYNYDVVREFCPGLVTVSIDDDGAEYTRANPLIPTLEGSMMCKPGDWIIRGVKGEFYPCKPDIFEATYEATGSEAHAHETSEQPDARLFGWYCTVHGNQKVAGCESCLSIAEKRLACAYPGCPNPSDLDHRHAIGPKVKANPVGCSAEWIQSVKRCQLGAAHEGPHRDGPWTWEGDQSGEYRCSPISADV